MSETRFTKGPWYAGTVDDFGDVPIEHGGEALAIATVTNGDVKAYLGRSEEHEANASLIAAAPELYGALEELDQWHSHHAADAQEWDEKSTVKIYLTIGDLRNIRAALAKARGEA